ncbi:Protein RTM1 [Sphaceloma murrayae]|uniref:Protein RTM1 n=1 Tax=Sphaceloma murrayae TaxID=2082308 RepID=A0A2K1QIU6_9PEZI|nr:Protein RTM1 [Sphaceloma murrayae]
MAVLKPYKNDEYIWKYLPSIPAAAIFTALFFIGGVLVSIRMVRTSTYFVIPFLLGAIFECVGYIFRIVGYFDTSALAPFIVQSLLLLVAPALYAASIYMVLGRIIRYVRGEQYSIIRVKWLTKIFVTGDIVSFLVQGAGGGSSASTSEDASDKGNTLIIVGLVIQIVLFSFFAVTAVVFHIRVRKAREPMRWNTEVKWESLLYMLYATSILILIRSVFRLIEWVQGEDGYLLSQEWPLYIFDALLMWAATMVFWWWYPAGITGSVGDVETESLDDNVPMTTHKIPSRGSTAYYSRN